MRSFIYEVLQSLQHQGGEISKYTFILPSKRAGIFLKQELAKQLKAPIFLPEIISIENFAEELSGLQQVSSFELLFEFYLVYEALTPKNDRDSFERFSKWAPTVLQDFNEIDRYLINPEAIFNYIEAIQDINHWSLDPNPTLMMKGYLKFWKSVFSYYTVLGEQLLKKKCGYQGQIYRQASQNIKDYLRSTNRERHIFIGFNALNTAESQIIQHLLQQEKAQVFWDAESSFLHNNHHDAGLFMRRYMKSWSYYKKHPFNTISNHYKTPKNISITGASKSIGQVQYVGMLLEELNTQNKLDRTAVVLADESLLLPLLNALPAHLNTVNITMGLPLSAAPITTFVEHLFALHLNSTSTFYHKSIIKILSHPLVWRLFERYSSKDAQQLVKKIKDNNLSSVSVASLKELAPKSAEIIDLLFKSCENNPIIALDQLIKILEVLKSEINQQPTLPLLDLEYISRFLGLFSDLKQHVENYPFISTISVLHQLFQELLRKETLDFKGQPLEGLQVMGMLESRVLDFETVVIVSVNEGILPAGKTQNSFIPFDVKLQNNLPTHKEKDAIYTYHFYRLIHRAETVHLVYNTDSDPLKGGEPSRFITQLKLDKHHKINHQIVTPTLSYNNQPLLEIPKTPNIMKTLREIAKAGLSPSSLGQYIRNPIDFYNQRVLGVKEAGDLEETIEANTFGSVVHRTLEAFYKPLENTILRVEHLEPLLTKVDVTTRYYFKLLYKAGDISSGKNRISFEIAKRYVSNCITEEIKLLQQGHEIKLLAIEKSIEITLDFPEFDFPIKLKGQADRIDTFNGTQRIIDYKTSKVNQSELNLVHWEDLTVDYKLHYKSFQVLSYAYMLQKMTPFSGPLESGIISFKNLNSGFLKFTKKDKPGQWAQKETLLTSEILSSYEAQLKSLLEDLFSLENPFLEKEI